MVQEAPKVIIKRKEKPVEESESDTEDPKRDLMTTALTKSNQTGNYYLLTLNYEPSSKEYLFTLKDTTQRHILCKK